ncbi:beta-1,3-glucan-binding-like protein [Achlya hypogyna]|uniref:Beta-1,3-glucan-binding-like protein n=1 Tax=Achlya hypogyna TaxID=1202772 RepID=A0A1V9YNW5_ACHHY|nr:beta-1,3-glucan-binding-like protein [Achlya hypogyna]
MWQTLGLVVAGAAIAVGGKHEEYLIFEDNFDDAFDLSVWKHDITLGGNGNREFQAYVNSRNNSYVKDGKLHLRATLTDEAYGDAGVTAGVMDLWGTSPYSSCSSPQFVGCRKQAVGQDILPPVQSARIQTMESFSFKYGRIEIKTKLPKGDWLWPGIWMMAKDNKYGPWPSSGELDIMESRGNGPDYTDDKGDPIGNNRFSSCFHFGPAWNKDAYPVAVNDTKALPDHRSYGDEFHTFGFYWDEDEMFSYIDTPDQVVTRVAAYGKKSFWDIGLESGAWFANDSYNNFQDGPINAPFDQEMYLIMNVAVGGTSIAKGFLDSGYFPDDRGNKPWRTNDSYPHYNFYSQKDKWLDTWTQGGALASDMAAMQIDSVKVWGLRGLSTFTNSKNPVHTYDELDNQTVDPATTPVDTCDACGAFADALPSCIHPATRGCFAKAHLGAACFDATVPCAAPTERLIFHDAFDSLDDAKWQREVTMTGSAHSFMHMFVNRRENAHVDNGRLLLTPTLTQEVYGSLDNSTIDLWGEGYGDQCTSNYKFGCLQTGNAAEILPPVLSASLRTEKSFSFKYGRVELRAKVPKGQWLRPTFRLLPKYDSYGEWPQSGEITVLEGNADDLHSGVAFGAFNDTRTLHASTTDDGDYHTYGLYWDETELFTYIDDPTNVVNRVRGYGNASFWATHWDPATEADVSPWRHRPVHAPFDQLMYLNIALRVGGTDGFFADGIADKPWKDSAINHKASFYAAKDSWWPTWKGATFEVDDVKVWATTPTSTWAYHGAFDAAPVVETTMLATTALAAAPPSVIFSDEFDTLNMRKWKPEITMNTDGFEMYVNHRQTAFVADATLNLHPALSSDMLGEWMLTQGYLDMWGTDVPSKCTSARNDGCGHVNTPADMAKPITSASLRTAETFSFRYGRVEVAATLPLGDWLRPTIELVAMDTSGASIQVAAGRGNRVLQDPATGADWSWRRVYSGVCVTADACNVKSRVLAETEAPERHVFGVDWGPDEIVTYIDDPANVVTRQPTPPSLQQDMYLVVRLAVGGTSTLPHAAFGVDKTPWNTTEPFPHTSFYAAKESWWPSWAASPSSPNHVSPAAAFQIHSVRVTAEPESRWRYHRLVGDADQTRAALQTASDNAPAVPSTATVASVTATYVGPATASRSSVIAAFNAYLRTALVGAQHVVYGSSMVDAQVMATVAYEASAPLDSVANHAHFKVASVHVLASKDAVASLAAESRHVAWLRRIVYAASGLMLSLLAFVLVRWGITKFSRRNYVPIPDTM